MERVISTDGTVLASYSYDAWGRVLTSTGTLAAANPIRYRGYYYDTETNLYYLQSRYYDPEVGRFVNADDAGQLGADGVISSANLFVYCGNNASLRIDDSGNIWNYIIGAAVGGIIAGVTTYIQTGDPKQAVIAGFVGAANGAIAASGLGIVAQAGVSALVAGVGDAISQIVDLRETDKKYDPIRTIKNAALAGGCSIIGSALGKITSYSYEYEGQILKSRGQNKILTAYLKKDAGQSYSNMLKRGRLLYRYGKKLIDTGRGISSVTGSILTWGISQKYISQ